MAREQNYDTPYDPVLKKRAVRDQTVQQLDTPAPQNPYTDWIQNENAGQYDPSQSGEYAPQTGAYTPPPAATTAPASGGGDLRTQVQGLINGLGGNASPEALGSIEAQLRALGVTLQKDSQGTIRGRLYLPTGEAVDVVQNQGWGQPWTWIDRGASGGSASGGTNVPMGAPANIPLGRTTENDPFYQNQRAKILELLNQDPTAVTTDSPGVKGSVDAYRAEAERSRRDRLAAEMELLGSKGLGDSGASSSALSQGYEDMGRGVSNYAAQAVVQEMTARRDEVQQALQLATSMGMTQEAQDLSRQLANLNAAISVRGQDFQNTQFNDTLGWNMTQWAQQMPLQYLQLLLNG